MEILNGKVSEQNLMKAKHITYAMCKNEFHY